MGWETTIFNWLGFGRYNPTPPTLVPGSTGELQLDASGALKVTVVPAATARAMTIATSAPPTHWQDPAGLAGSAVLRNSSATLYRVQGSNEGTEKRWVMLFDAAAIPPEGTLPVLAVPVVEGGTFALELPRGRAFAKGIVWAASRMPGGLIVDHGAQLWVNAEYA